MKKINFINNDAPYLSAENLNQMQDNIETDINELITEEYKEGASLIISSSNITLVNAYYKRYGKVVTFKMSFHVTSDITNSTTFATLNIPPSKTGFYSVIRSAANGKIGAVNITGANNLELKASGTLSTDEWYTVAATYVSA